MLCYYCHFIVLCYQIVAFKLRTAHCHSEGINIKNQLETKNVRAHTRTHTESELRALIFFSTETEHDRIVFVRTMRQRHFHWIAKGK